MLSKQVISAEAGFDSEDDVVNQCTILVKRIAHHLLGRLPPHVRVDDLIQVGMMALLEAARQYDANRGASFTTYAGIRIRGAMLDEVRRNDWVPRSVHRNARKISETIHQLENEMGQSASDHEIAKRLDISLSEYHAMLLDSVGSQLCALEDIEGFAETYAEGLSNEVIEPCEDLVQNKFQQALAEAIEKLPEREKMIVALYYDEELNLKEIGKVLNITESRVSQINSQAMARLRSYLLDWL